jgi:hypothetical protein
MTSSYASLATLSAFSSKDAEGGVDYGDQVLIPDGTYQAVFLHHETHPSFRSAKVFLHFRIVDLGPGYEKSLYRAYRAKRIEGKPGRGGRFRLHPRSELFLMLCRVNGVRARPDRVSTSWLKGLLLEVRTRTVTHDFRQRPLAEFMRYSVVDDVIQVLGGHGTTN